VDEYSTKNLNCVAHLPGFQFVEEQKSALCAENRNICFIIVEAAPFCKRNGLLPATPD
jgi:hypothetical protein